FQGSAVGSLAPLLREVSHGFQDPATGQPLYNAWKVSAQRTREQRKEAGPVSDANLVDTRIGSGSDHTVFLNHVGMPVIGLDFDGPYGVYHSMYDDFYWINHFGDPGYRYHTLMSQLWGVIALRLANADLLPFDFGEYGENIGQFVDEMAKGKDLGRLDLRPLRSAIADFVAAGRKLDAAEQQALASGKLNPALEQQVNQGAMQVERNWLNPQGIPGRPWFEHMLYGARYTYAHLEIPAITEAVEKADWTTAQQQTELLRQAVEKNTRLLQDLTNRLQASAQSGGHTQ
ncbi:MAG TPA: transferrin receptor-like dimerization domain-containing protein, partial [Terriglobia bacterium]|nr:transferrin receptor-like dimerization domain-containing protein [Terriglobia bacterium]